MVLAHKPREEGSTAEHTKVLETSIYHHTYTFQVYLIVSQFQALLCALLCVLPFFSCFVYSWYTISPTAFVLEFVQTHEQV